MTQRLVRKTIEPTKKYLPNTLRIASLAADVKAIDIRAHEVAGLTIVADSFVICSASSEPQFRAIYNKVKTGMKEAGVSPLHTEGDSTGAWLVLDYGDVVFHIFREEARAFYDLDGLWADAPEIPLDLEP